MQKIRFISLYLARRLADHCKNVNGYMLRKDAAQVILCSRFTSKNVNRVMNDLKMQGLIEFVNKENIKINKNKIAEDKEWF